MIDLVRPQPSRLAFLLTTCIILTTMTAYAFDPAGVKLNVRRRNHARASAIEGLKRCCLALLLRL